jgi:hypothetical protein
LLRGMNIVPAVSDEPNQTDEKQAGGTGQTPLHAAPAGRTVTTMRQPMR